MTDPMTCSCPSGDGSLRWPCLAHPPADVEPAALLPEIPPTDLERFAAALGAFQAALFDALAPAALAIVRAMTALADALEALRETVADDVRDSWPVRWLNRRARRAAMRRHPAGRIQVVELSLQLPDAGQPDAGQPPTSAEALARYAGIRLPDPEQLQRQLDAEMARMLQRALRPIRPIAFEPMSDAELREYARAWHPRVEVRRPSAFVRPPHVH